SPRAEPSGSRARALPLSGRRHRLPLKRYALRMRWVVCVVALAACGDDTGDTDAGVPTNTGYVVVSTFNAMGATMPIVGGGASAQFTLNTVSMCTFTAAGSCDFYVCPGAPG